ncbi:MULTISPECIES: nitronate monooxygenase [unclassified Arthrobacter]|uniref:nitronate monooxygenase n=1 Tax=unclassified Arthrobacter TaxID=235627 RepID=UPI00159E5409|nr:MULTISPECIES: nitronate monooxygenase [unclassified Arthrobacter]MCQ9165836.1 nitronate monooxygenase [Arthrobacter sp. STN4]NVM99727.1 nitronate monooxygenase [Arthrobacter sp. SDTb3-6]
MFASPIIIAPMAGGTTTPELALAARGAGAFVYAAGGYLTATALAGHLAPLRAAGGDFGVNLFVPRSGALPSGDAAALARYRTELAGEAERLGTELPAALPDAADPKARDFWDEKLDLLLNDPVPLVSFTFGLAPESVVSALHGKGTRVVASVTGVEEALAAAATGVDALVVQHANAGGHSAAFLPDAPQGAPGVVELVAQVRSAVGLPLVGAGGIGDAATARAVLAAGAEAVQLGTAVLRSDESGARALHKEALADPAFTATAVTRAFTGRAARALVNDFVRAHSAGAPHAYPEVHFLTGPLRAAAGASGDRAALNLWAGTAWQKAAAGPVADIVRGFLDGL